MESILLYGNFKRNIIMKTFTHNSFRLTLFICVVLCFGLNNLIIAQVNPDFILKYKSTTPFYTNSSFYETGSKILLKTNTDYSSTPVLNAKFTIDATGTNEPSLKILGPPTTNTVPGLKISGYKYGIETDGSIHIMGSDWLNMALLTEGNILCNGVLNVNNVDLDNNSIFSVGTIKAPKVNTNLLFFGDRNSPGNFYTCSSGFDFYVRDPMFNCESGQNVNPNLPNIDRTLRITHGHLEVLGILQTSGFQLNDGFEAQGKVLVSDRNGFGNWTSVGDIIKGDNLGNHIADKSLQMLDYSIYYGLSEGKASRLDGTTFFPGLRFTTANSMVLETTNESTLKIISSTDANSSIWVGNWNSGGFGFVKNSDKATGGIYWDGNNPQPVISFNTTKVGIGIMPPVGGKYNLYVTGGILTEEVKVQLKNGAEWSDYVFATGYKLRPLSELKAFILNNNHLPEIPSAETVKQDGINLGEMDALLLKKIEELTLYILEQQKQIDELKAAITK